MKDRHAGTTAQRRAVERTALFPGAQRAPQARGWARGCRFLGTERRERPAPLCSPAPCPAQCQLNALRVTKYGHSFPCGKNVLTPPSGNVCSFSTFGATYMKFLMDTFKNPFLKGSDSELHLKTPHISHSITRCWCIYYVAWWQWSNTYSPINYVLTSSL